MAIVGDAHIQIHAITAGFKQEVERALKDLEPILKRSGQDMGDAFSKNFNRGMGRGNLFGNFGREAEAAREKFNRLIRVGYKLGPVISLLVSGIGDLAMGLFAVGSAAGAAIPSVVALGGAFAAMIQGMATAKIAMGGLGEAMKAMKAPQGGGTNDRAIEDSRRRLALVYQRSAEQMANANDKVRDAQIALNQAYEQGLESLQQLGFSAEDAALAQDRAAIQLERSRESLMRVLDLDPNDRARREAELAFKEAELNYRKTTDQVNDLREQQEYAAATGVEGTKEVIDAKNALYEAESERAKQERDNAQDIAEAQRAIAAAMAEGAKSSNATSEALKKISPEAKKFLEYFISLEDTFLQLRFAAGRGLFPALETALATLVEKLFPTLEVVLERTGFVLGGFVKKLANVLSSAKNLDIINRIFGEANLVIFRKLTNSLVNLVDVLFNVLDAAAPLTRIFANYVERLTESLRMSTAVGNATGQLSEKFLRAGEVTKTISRFLRTTYEGFRELGRSAVVAGEKILDYFSQGAEKLKAFSEEGRKTGELTKYFDRVADNFIAISGFLGEIIVGLFALGGNPGVGQFFEALRPVTQMFIQMAYLLSTMGPTLAEFANQFTRMLLVFTETGGIEMFFKVLTAALNVIANIFTNDIVVRVFMFLAIIKGLTLAFGTLLTVGKFAFKVFVGNLLVLPNMAAKASGSMGVLSAGFAMTAASIGAAGERLRIFNMTAGAGSLVGFKTFIAGLRANIIMLKFFGIELLKSYIIMVRNIFSMKTFGIVAKGLGKALIAPIVGLQKLTAALIKTRWGFTLLMANPIGAVIIGITIAIVALVAIFKKAYDASKPLQKAVASLSKAFSGAFAAGMQKINDAISDLIPGVDGISGLFKKIGDILAKYVMPIIQRVVVGAMGLAFDYIVYVINAIKLGLDLLLFPFKALYHVINAIRTGSLEPLKNIWNDFISLVVDGVNLLIRAFNLLPLPDIKPLADDLGQFTIESDKAAGSQKKQNSAMEEASKVFKKQRKAAQELYTEYGSLEDITNKINGALETEFEGLTSTARATIDNIQAKKELKDAQTDFRDSLKDLKIDTLDSDVALANFADTYLDAAENAFAAGKSQKEVEAIIKQGRKAFIDGAKDIGHTADEAKRLADNFGLSPDVITKTFEAKGLGDLQQMTRDLEGLNKLITGSKSPNAIDRTVTQKIAFEAELNKAMFAAFGRGQDPNYPLFVQEVEPTPKLPAKALGGPVSSNQSYLVGERGPEIFSPANSGTIIPNDRIGVGSGMSITVNAGPGMDEMELANVVSRKVAWTMRRGA